MTAIEALLKKWGWAVDLYIWLYVIGAILGVVLFVVIIILVIGQWRDMAKHDKEMHDKWRW